MAEKQVYYGWADEEVDVLLNKEFLKWLPRKMSIAREMRIDFHEAVKTDLSQVTVPEIISGEISRLSGNNHLRDAAAVLQSYQTYSLSIYDIINDQHMIKCGKPTFLKLYGIDEVKRLQTSYRYIVSLLANELETNGVKNAPHFARAQYEETLNADDLRNLPDGRMPTPKETINIMNSIAGGTAKYMALLTNAGQPWINIAESLANSMANLEDLIDFMSLEDFKKIKATLPFALLYHQTGLIDTSLNAKRILDETSVIPKTKEYIFNQLNIISDNLNGGGKGSLLGLFERKMRSFLESFPETYSQ